METLESEGYIVVDDGLVTDVTVNRELAYYQDGPPVGELVSGTLRPENPDLSDAAFDRVEAVKIGDQFGADAQKAAISLGRVSPKLRALP